MKIPQLISCRTPLVLYGAMCVVASVTLSGTGFIYQFPSGFWRTAVALALAFGFAFGVFRAIVEDSDSFEEMGARLVAFAIFTALLSIGVRWTL
jgi:hypothetical protein